MQELRCQTCNKILGFTNKANYQKAKRPTIVKCIDCYFIQIKELAEK